MNGRGFALAALAGALVSALVAGGARAETVLERRPSDRLEPATAERFARLADAVGWGSLFKTEQMARADTAYGAGPVLAVTATPYLPLMYFLESRAWAIQRFLSLEEADRRFTETYLDPGQALAFDLLVIAESPKAIGEEALAASFFGPDGAAVAADLVDHAISLEPTLGGELHAARARMIVTFTQPPVWPQLEGMTLRVEADGQAFDLEWRFSNGK